MLLQTLSREYNEIKACPSIESICAKVVELTHTSQTSAELDMPYSNGRVPHEARLLC